jgi:hypothetical protein
MCVEDIGVKCDDTFDVSLRTAVYRHFATTGQSPTLDATKLK